MTATGMAGRILLLGAALALAACAAHEPPAAPPDAAAETPSAWTVSDRGYGQVRIGMTPAEASKAFGRPLLPLNANEDEACSYLFPEGNVEAEVAFMVTDGTIARVDVDTPGIATAAGAEVGDTEASVLALHADAEVQPHKYGGPEDHYVIVRAPDGAHALVLETSDGMVDHIRAGRLPEAGYIEGCS